VSEKNRILPKGDAYDQKKKQNKKQNTPKKTQRTRARGRRVLRVRKCKKAQHLRNIKERKKRGGGGFRTASTKQREVATGEDGEKTQSKSLVLGEKDCSAETRGLKKEK